MKITYKGDYAIRAILDLAYRFKSGEIVALADICSRQNIPEKYLEQIMLVLKKGGYVDSKRGIGGGFFLKKSPGELTLGDVIRYVDGPLEPTAGIKNENMILQVNNEDQKAFEEVWVEVTQAIADVVDRVTFADIMQRAEELRKKSAEFNYII